MAAPPAPLPAAVPSDDDADADAGDQYDEEALRQRAAAEERLADEKWRQLQEEQRRREEAQEREAWRKAQEAQAALAERQQAARQRRFQEQQEQRAAAAAAAKAAASGGATGQEARPRGENEADAAGWTPLEQKALEAALRACPAGGFATKNERWQAIAARVPGRTAKQCLQRCQQLKGAVVKALPPPLLRLDADLLFLVLERLGGRALCACAAVCKELLPSAHDDLLWTPMAEALPDKWRYSRRDRDGEPPWKYTLRTHEALYGSWRKLQEHRQGLCPYLPELGR